FDMNIPGASLYGSCERSPPDQVPAKHHFDGVNSGCNRALWNLGCLCGQMMVLGRPNLPATLAHPGLIDRYLARSIAVPLIGSLVLAAMLLVLDKMLRLFQYVVDAGGPVSVVWRMLANLLPEYLSLGIPIGLMLGILLAFRKLALSSELDALRGIGMGYGRMLRVPFAYA